MRHEYPAAEIGLRKHIWQASSVVNVETKMDTMLAGEHWRPRWRLWLRGHGFRRAGAKTSTMRSGEKWWKLF